MHFIEPLLFFLKEVEGGVGDTTPLCFHFCSDFSETQDPRQMGVLINSRLSVTHFGVEKENACMYSQHNSCCRLPAALPVQWERLL